MPKRYCPKSSGKIEDDEVFERVDNLEDTTTQILENIRDLKWDLEDYAKSQSLCLFEHLTCDDIADFLEYIEKYY